MEASHNSIPDIEKRFVDLHDDAHTRPAALAKCARSADALGNRVFALRATGLCASSPNARAIYRGYNETCSDNSGFTGNTFLYNKTHVYELTVGKRSMTS